MGNPRVAGVYALRAVKGKQGFSARFVVTR